MVQNILVLIAFRYEVKKYEYKTSHGFVDENDVNIFRGKTEIDECTLLGSSRTHVGARNRSL